MLSAKTETLSRIAAILTTLEETGGAPESMLYIFFDMDMDWWSRVRRLMIEADFISIKSNYVTLTNVGRETARKLNSKLGAQDN